jgi:hypothetical protein
MGDERESHPVFVETVSIDEGRQIGWSDGLADRLRERLDDIRAAVRDGSEAIAGGLDQLSGSANWEIDEVTATFGVSLAAEAGAIISKASGEATIEVALKYRRIR